MTQRLRNTRPRWLAGAAVALWLAGCLNPRPEDLPSQAEPEPNTDSDPGPVPVDGEPSGMAGTGGANGAPPPQQPPPPPPPTVADAGVPVSDDSGCGDAGAGLDAGELRAACDPPPDAASSD